MTIVNLVIFLFFLGGIILIFDIKATDVISLFKKDYSNPLKEKINLIVSNKSKFFIINYYNEIKNILTLIEKEEMLPRLIIITLFLSFVLSYICIMLENIFLIPIAILLSMLLPLITLKIYQNNYKKQITNSLESALSLITTSYLRHEDIVEAVSENIKHFSFVPKKIFNDFLIETKYLNENITTALVNLKNRISDKLFDEYVNNLIILQEDKSKKYILNDTITKFSNIKTINLDLSLNLYEPVKEFLTMAILTIINIPLIYLLNKDWFNILTTTVLGKFMIALSILLILIGVYNIPKIIKPIEIDS